MRKYKDHERLIIVGASVVIIKKANCCFKNVRIAVYGVIMAVVWSLGYYWRVKMRTEQEMLDLILRVAKDNESIRAVSMEGSRANPNAPKDKFMDYDITYYVNDIKPFYNNPTWVIKAFGKPLIMQMPEAMRYPCGDGNFNYMMIYSDGVRIDLSFVYEKYADDGEPSITILDKDNGNGFRPSMPPPNDMIYHLKPPDELFYYSCCNNFWWCLNNVAKGIVRDELSYTMSMLNDVVRSELHDMMGWYIGTQHGFNLSVGKDGKYFKHYLSSEIHAQYAATYSGNNYSDIWMAIYTMCDLFHTLALTVADHFKFSYKQHEEDGIREYIRMVKAEINFNTEVAKVSIVPYERKYHDDMLFCFLAAKDAIGGYAPDPQLGKPTLKDDLLDVKKNYFERSDMFWLAIDKHDRVVGMVGTQMVAHTELWLKRLFIKPKLKGKGVGSKLISTVEEYAAGKGITEINTQFAYWYREAAVFYPAKGFVEVERNDHLIHMKKRLRGV
jgi:aminoglycoside 6-adenylyltransferase